MCTDFVIYSINVKMHDPLYPLISVFIPYNQLNQCLQRKNYAPRPALIWVGKHTFPNSYQLIIEYITTLVNICVASPVITHYAGIYAYCRYFIERMW